MSRSEGHDQRNNAFREAFLKPLDFAASAPPTAEQITTTAQKLGLAHTVEDVSGSYPFRIHWLGDRKADKVLLYFHGGGFSLPALEGHVKFLAQSIDKLKAARKDLCVAMLEYTLCPKARYPVQIIQACDSLHFLLSKGYKSSQILIGGDSAGGNLSLAVLSVISHGFEGVQPFTLEGKLAGALLVSPWVSFGGKSESWRTNITKDIIGLDTTDMLIGVYATQPEEYNSYSEPIKAEGDWWKNLAVQTILNVYGSYEVLCDEQSQMSRILQESGNSVEDVAGAMQVHVDNVLDAQTDMDPGEMSQAIWQWLGKVV